MSKSLLLLLAAAVPALAELPEFYRHVDRVIWVVDDVDRTVAGWQKLGMIEARANQTEAADMVVPAMKVRDFNFTEVTRF